MSRARGTRLRPGGVLACVLALVAASGLGAARAAGAVEVTASIAPDAGITDTQPIELVIRIAGSDVPRVAQPRLPTLLNLRVVNGPNTASSFQSVNGRVSVVQSFRYTLLAQGAGPAEVPSIEIDVGGTVHRTEPIRFEVSRGGTGPPGTATGSEPSGDDVDVFLRARVSNERVWSGQGVVYQLDLLDAEGVAEIDWIDVPSFSDFWIEDDAVQTRAESYTTNVGGRPYRVWPLVRKVLVPTRAGEFTIEPYAVRVAVSAGRWDPFSDPFRSRRKTVVRKTDPVTIRVRALPEEGRPESFSGAVGDFSLSSDVDRTTTSVDDAVTLRVTVSGAGFLKSTAAPRLGSTPQLRVFEPKISDAARVRSDGLESSKAWEWVLVPLSVGEVELPEVEFAFFDPEAGEYRTLRSQPTVLEVSGRAEGGGRAGATPLSPDRLDIAYVKLRFGPLREATVPLHRTLAFQVLMWAPFAVVPLVALAGRRRARLLADRGLVRSREARRRARKRLKAVERRLTTEGGARFHEEVARALVDYVADRFDRSPSGLTYDLVDTLLASRGAPEDLRGEFRRCLETCDFARYVPSSDEAGRRRELLDNARSLVDRLEAAW